MGERPLDSAVCAPSIAQVRGAIRQARRALRAGVRDVRILVAEDGSIFLDDRGD